MHADCSQSQEIVPASPEAQRTEIVDSVIAPGIRVGRYVVRQLIDRDAFRSVWRAERVKSRVQAAGSLYSACASARFGNEFRACPPLFLTVLNKKLRLAPQAADRFALENHAINSLRPPNLLRFRDFGRLQDSWLYFVSNLVPGMTAQDLLTTKGPLEDWITFRILQAACDSLRSMHGRDIVHGDLHPANIVIDGPPQHLQVWLREHGLTRLFRDSIKNPSEQDHEMLAARCMSPEQLTGQRLDARTDVYGLGALAYQLITGVAPFEAERARALGEMHLYADRPQPSSRSAEFHKFDDIISKAMAVDPAERFQNVSEFIGAFASKMVQGTSPLVLSEEVAGEGVLTICVDAHVEKNSCKHGEAAVQELITIASNQLADHGFRQSLYLNNRHVFAIPLQGDKDGYNSGARQAAIAVAKTIYARLKNETETPAQILRIGVHVGDSADSILSWLAKLPNAQMKGVFGCDRVVEGLETETTALSDEHHRLGDV